MPGLEITERKKTMSAEQRINILLVDDRKEDLLALELILKNSEYNLIKAESGRDALRILINQHDFAIILMDVHMPLLDGFETAALIRERDKLKSIPIIFLTANNEKLENIFRGYKTGAVDYMIKPVTPEIIRAKVGIFAELYKKTNELYAQRKSLLALNKELEERTREITRSNKELEKFAYVASHDMQEPLRTIISFVQLMQDKLKIEKDSEIAVYMDYIVNAGYRMRDLITGLLEYSRINRTGEEQEEEVDVNDVMKEVLNNMSNSIKEYKAVITTDVFPTVSGSHLQMVRLLQNLVSNAIKFNKTGEPRVKISCKKNDRYYQFAVEDNGIGIAENYIGKIFELFQRLHPIGEYEGTGIGLAVCKKIVERQGGKIWVESLAGKGSTFYFTLPDNTTDMKFSASENKS